MDKEYYKNKYLTATIRLNHWDYAWPAMYYVTICTHDRQCCLGEVKNDQVYLSKIGNIVFDDWVSIPKHFNYVELDDWIIMPNHMHGIIRIKENNDFDSRNCRDARSRVSTVRIFGPLQSKSLSAIIHAFKSAVKRQCNKNNLDFHWQHNYYEHVIRDEDDYARIKEYIANNPAKWAESKNNPINFK